jgi:transcriptional regulator with XRE-family HTH domain
MDWSDRIRGYRQRSGLTQEKLAEMFGVDARSVRRWEAGHSRPSEEVRTRLMRAPVPAMVRPDIAGFASVIRSSSAFTVLLDDNQDVIASSPSYNARMSRVHGPDWTALPQFERLYRPIADVIEDQCNQRGGLKKLMREGLSALTHDFLIERDGIEKALRFTSARLFVTPTESVHIHASFGIDRASAIHTRSLMTFLDEIRDG